MWPSEAQNRTINAEKPPFQTVFQRKVVRVTGFEPAASCSQSRRATNCATPGYSVFNPAGRILPKMWRPTNWATPGYSISVIIPQRGRKSKFFLSVVIYVVKAAFVPFSAIGGNPANAGVTRLSGVSPCPVPDTATALPKQARYQLRYTRLLSFLSGWAYSPKPGAIPTSLYPDTIDT